MTVQKEVVAMKIKSVCEKTGLTDRTVRYYIEEGLISPEYTENYLGRKKFEFSDENIAELNNISTLRAFGFSIEEIKKLASDPEISQQIIQKAKERADQNLVDEQKKIRTFSSLDGEKEYTVDELAKTLSFLEKVGASNENVKVNIDKKIIRVLKAASIFVIVWLPIIISVVMLAFSISRVKNPVFNLPAAILTAVAVLPSLFIFVFSKIKASRKNLIRNIFIIVCTLCIPLSFFFSKEIITDCEHEWSSFTTEEQATCASEGKITRVCENCRAEETVNIEKIAHTEVIDARRESTCTETGLTEGKHCSECGEVIVAQKIIGCKAHFSVIDPGYKPTCAAEGLTDGSHCSVCSRIIVAQKPIEKTAHSYVKSFVSANCAIEGYTLYKCSCGDSYKENVIPRVGEHVFEGNICTGCGLKVLINANADGSLSGGNDKVKFYIERTSIEDPSVPLTARLVIYGNGAMSDFVSITDPIWSHYEYEITEVIIESGVTYIGEYAFAKSKYDNLYKNVKSFIIKNKNLVIDKGDNRISGIICPITYQ